LAYKTRDNPIKIIQTIIIIVEIGESGIWIPTKIIATISNIAVEIFPHQEAPFT